MHSGSGPRIQLIHVHQGLQVHQYEVGTSSEPVRSEPTWWTGAIVRESHRTPCGMSICPDCGYRDRHEAGGQALPGRR